MLHQEMKSLLFPYRSIFLCPIIMADIPLIVGMSGNDCA